jgi:hypothetical protein
MSDGHALSSRAWLACLAVLVVAYGHHTIPHLTMMPRVNVDEPWLMERAYQVLHTGRPLQPMLGLNSAYCCNQVTAISSRRGLRCSASGFFRLGFSP